MTKEEKIQELLMQRGVLIAYAHSKIDGEDWHAVADAAMDLREIDAEIRGLRSVGII